MNFYHYTPAYRAAMVLRSGILQPSTVGLIESDTAYIWFSSNQKTDKTATIGSKTIALVVGDHSVRQVRFSYDGADLTPYAKLKIRLSHRRFLEKRAKGSLPIEWYGLKGCLSTERLILEDRIDGQWQPIDGDSLLSEFQGIDLKLFGNSVAFQFNKEVTV